MASKIGPITVIRDCGGKICVYTRPIYSGAYCFTTNGRSGPAHLCNHNLWALKINKSPGLNF